MVQFVDKSSGFNQWQADKKQTKKPLSGFLWWCILFLLSWWALGQFMSPKQSAENVSSENIPVVDLSAVPTHAITSDKIDATVQGLRISDVKLLGIPVSASDPSPVSLLSGPDAHAEFGIVAVGTIAPTAQTVWNTTSDNTYTWRNPDGVEFTRTITVSDYVISVSDTIRNTTGHDISIAPYARIVRVPAENQSAGVATGAIVYENSDLDRINWNKLSRRSYAYNTTNGFAGFADQYWETVANISTPDQTMTIKKTGDLFTSNTASNATTVLAGATLDVEYNLYAGPLVQSNLDTANAKIPGIDSSIDYGWFGFLARPMLWILNTLNALVMNYGVAIILMTLILRFLMWPLTRKSYTSMIAMQKMQPELQRVQKLYANDKMRLQMEMMKIYQTHKTSPMSGCLPMLIQIPIFFALYKALLISVQMRSAGFLWISDLAVMDPYFILPILMGATMWLQQYLQSANTQKNKSADKNDITAQTQKMMRWMPILFTIMFAWMPAGLVLYWTVSNIFGIVQMYIIKRSTK